MPSHTHSNYLSSTVLRCWLLLMIVIQPLCGMTQTLAGRDFWLMIPRHSMQRIYITAMQTARVNIDVPRNNQHFVLDFSSGESSVLLVPHNYPGFNFDMDESQNRPIDGGIHVTSTGDIALYAMAFNHNSLDMASIYPVTALGSHYIVQDFDLDSSIYQGYNQFGVVAQYDNTRITFTLPHEVIYDMLNGGTDTLAADSTMTVTLAAGQCYWIGSRSFSGMEVTANHPFGLFQGGQIMIDRMYHDYVFEQAMPVKSWGTDFIVSSPTTTSFGNYVIVTSSADSCLVEIDGLVTDTLQKGQTLRMAMAIGEVHRIRTCKPSSVMLFTTGSGSLEDDGDPSSVIIPTLDQGVKKAVFRALYTSYIHQVTLNIVVRTDAVQHMTLNAFSISNYFTPFDSTYSIASITLPDDTYTLENNHSPFVAYVYGIGMAESYSYLAGMRLNDISYALRPTDSVHLCQGETQTYCLINTPTADFVTRWYVDGELVNTGDLCFDYNDTTVGTHTIDLYVETGNLCDHEFHRVLQVSPAYHDTLSFIVYETDTFIFEGRHLTTSGEYVFNHPLPTGCDSSIVVNLTVIHDVHIDIDIPDEGICIGDTVTLDIHYVPNICWLSDPVDPSLAGQERHNLIRVAPLQTTTYILTGPGGRRLDSVVVTVSRPPQLCIEKGSSILDYDSPTIIVGDCSPGSTLHYWTFADGLQDTDRYVQHLLLNLPHDSADVHLSSCSIPNCCSDTTLYFPIDVMSIWFPNVFTPTLETNNRFGCITTYEVKEYQLLIFNRFGMCVFRSDDPNQHWDGTYNGTPLPQGSYAYQWRMRVTTDNLLRQGKGLVTLLR